MALETSGAWAPEATKVLKKVVVAAAATTGRPEGQLWQELLQGCAVCVRRANARAALRRQAVPASQPAAALAAAGAELQAVAEAN